MSPMIWSLLINAHRRALYFENEKKTDLYFF